MRSLPNSYYFHITNKTQKNENKKHTKQKYSLNAFQNFIARARDTNKYTLAS
jgi:hypothetical protein